MFNKYYIVFKKQAPNDLFLNFSNVKHEIFNYSNLFHFNPIWENMVFPYEGLRNNNIDVFLSAAYTLPVIPIRGKKTVTIHDISYIVNPEWFPLRNRLMYKFLTKPTIKKADIVFTVSQFSKKGILERYNINPDKIVVTYLGANQIFLKRVRVREGIDILKNKYKLKGKKILYVGLIMNHRNIPTIIDAVSQLSKHIGKDFTLVIIGKNVSYSEINMKFLIEKFNLKDNVLWLSYVNDEEIVSFYNIADTFIYPSSYEDFGMTPLEAMSFGIPTITSNLSAIPEIVGDAACLLQNPTDSKEMKDVPFKVLTDDKLRDGLKTRGFERCKLFTWEDCAYKAFNKFAEIVNR